MSGDLETVKQLARSAGVEVADDRVENIVRALAGTAQISQTLSKVDYGEAEPSSRFRAPKAEK